MHTPLLVLASAAVFASAAAPALAKTAPGPTDWRWSYSAAGFNVVRSDLDNGGSAGMAGLFVGLPARCSRDAVPVAEGRPRIAQMADGGVRRVGG
jgi:hypothetical protein